MPSETEAQRDLIPVRIEAHLTASQIDTLSAALGELSFSESLQLQLNPDSSETIALTESGFRTDRLEFVDAAHTESGRGGWFVSWQKLREHALKDFDSGDYRRGTVTQRAMAAYKIVQSNLVTQLDSEPNDLSYPIEGTYRLRPPSGARRRPRFDHNYTDLLVTPESLEGFVNTYEERRAAAEAIGAAGRRSESFPVLRNYVQDLRP